MKICAACSPVWRMISSMLAGVGPSASMTRSRSSSPGGGVAEKSGGSSNCTLPSDWMPALGAIASMTSRASVTRIAPSFKSSLAPAARGSSGEPGTAKTSRPISPASLALISDPERFAASITTRPSARPAIMRLRRGKSLARGSHPNGISKPPRRHSRRSRRKVGVFGRIGRSSPPASTRDSSGCQAALMRRRVDAARQAGDDGMTFAAELGGEAARAT